jgi:Uncharacterized protein conserved in bacteria (DUF2314)
MTQELARCSICGEVHPLATMVTGHRQPEELPDSLPDAFAEPSGWWLQDAEELHAEHPRSFFIPPRDRRSALRAGECVRLGFAYGPHADREGEGHVERMWVEVIEQRSDGHAHGRVRNTPVRLTEVGIGDLVAFEPRNVLSIDYTDDELGYRPDEEAVVDQAVIREDRAPHVVVRGPSPDVEGEEAWWMLSLGAQGPVPGTLASLTDRFPGLEEPLRAGAGLWELSGGERAEARWRRVSEEEIAATAEWRDLRVWLESAARSMRPG